MLAARSSFYCVWLIPCSLGALVSLERHPNYSNVLSILNCFFCPRIARTNLGTTRIKGREVKRCSFDLARRRQSGLSASTARSPPWSFILKIYLGLWISSLHIPSLSPIPVTLDLFWCPSPQFPSTPRVMVSAPVDALSCR